MLALSVGAARAGAPADFHAAVDTVAAHNRATIDYLRAGDADLALRELEALEVAWGELTGHFAGKQPDAHPRLDIVIMTDISTRLVAADLLLKSGRLDAARQSLEDLRQDLGVLRAKTGPRAHAK